MAHYAPSYAPRPNARAIVCSAFVCLIVAAAFITALMVRTDVSATGNTYTLYQGNPVPKVVADYDPNSLEVGVSFAVSQPGSVQSIRYYKSSANTGQHVGTLWNSAGKVLATGTFERETTSGWQVLTFAKQVQLVPGTTYVASYHTNVGYYASQNGVFDKGPTLGSSTVWATSGVYAYGARKFPQATYEGSAYFVDVAFQPAAAGGPTSSTPAPAPSTTSKSTTPAPAPSTTSKSTTPAPAPSSTAPASGSFVQPGSVGYRGSLSALTSYAPGGAAPAGCGWQSYGLRCDGTTLTLDHAYVHGGIIFTGGGAVSITNSIIEGGTGSEWYVFYDGALSSSARMTFTDTTLRWQAGSTYPSGYDVAPIWQRSNESMDVERCDISGLPQGLDPSGNSTVKNNWIHGLFQNSTSSSSPTHLDGIFSQGGNNITITGNYVDAPMRNPSDITAAVFFQDIPYSPMTNVVVTSNYLHGGSFTLRNESAQGLVVTNNVFGGGTYGAATNISPATIGVWSGNTSATGSVVPKPGG